MMTLTLLLFFRPSLELLHLSFFLVSLFFPCPRQRYLPVILLHILLFLELALDLHILLFLELVLDLLLPGHHHLHYCRRIYIIGQWSLPFDLCFSSAEVSGINLCSLCKVVFYTFKEYFTGIAKCSRSTYRLDDKCHKIYRMCYKAF